MQETKQVIVVRSDLKMVRGKEDAQVAHASGAFIFRQIQKQISEGKHEYSVQLTDVQKEWITNSYAKVVLVAHSEEELKDISQRSIDAHLETHEIIDSGRTQFNGVPTLTCVAIGPDYVERIDAITGHLKLR